MSRVRLFSEVGWQIVASQEISVLDCVVTNWRKPKLDRLRDRKANPEKTLVCAWEVLKYSMYMQFHD